MLCTVFSPGLQLTGFIFIFIFFGSINKSGFKMSRIMTKWPCVQVEYREGSRGVGATNETCFMLFTQAPLMSAVFAPSGRRQSDTLAIASLSSVGLTQVILSLNSLGYNPNTLHSAQHYKHRISGVSSFYPLVFATAGHTVCSIRWLCTPIPSIF